MDDIKTIARAWANLPRFGTVRASADGRWAFWCSPGDKVDDIFCAPVDRPGGVEQLTFGADHFDLRDVSADGQVLVVGQSQGGSPHPHLMLLDRRVGNRLRLLTPKQDDYRIIGGALTRDGQAAIFAADFDYAAQRPVQRALLWRQDLTTGARACLARLPAMPQEGPRLSPSGRRILLNLSARGPGGGQIWVANTDGSGLREVFVLGQDNRARGVWLDDDRIVVVGDRAGRDEVGVFSLTKGATQWLAGEPALCPAEVVVGRGGFACLAHQDATARVRVFDASGPRALANPSGRRSLVPRAGLPDGGWLAEAYDADGPPELLRLSPDGTCRRLTVAPTSPRRHRAPRDFRWTGSDGRKVQGWLFEPETRPRGLVVHVRDGDAAEDRADPMTGFWVQTGYAVLEPNPRGAEGFGCAWRHALRVDGWGGREQEDIRTGIEAAISRGFAPRKVAVVGTGFGGYAAWHAITRFPDLVSAAIPIGGVYRLDLAFSGVAARCVAVMGGGPAALADRYADASPGHFIHNIRGHLLIVHGAQDGMVSPENLRIATQELTAAGIPHEVMLWENEGPGLRRKANLEAFLLRSAAFLERALSEGFRGGGPS